MLRASDHLEPLFEVKAQRLGVLLVHFQLVGIHMLDRIAQQLPAKALATLQPMLDKLLEPEPI